MNFEERIGVKMGLVMFFVSLVICILGLVCIVIGVSSENKVWGYAGAFLLIISVCMTFGYLDGEHNRDIEHAKECIENGATVYLHGQEIDGLHVNLENYEITFEEGFIILDEIK